MIHCIHTYIILFCNMFWSENVLKLLYSCFLFLKSDLIDNINWRSKLLLRTYDTDIYEAHTFNWLYCILHEYTKLKQLHKMLRVFKIINLRVLWNRFYSRKRGILNFPCCQPPRWSPNRPFTFSVHCADVPFLVGRVRVTHHPTVCMSLSCVYTSRGARHAQVTGQASPFPSCITLSFSLTFLVLYARVSIIRYHIRLSAPDMFSRVDSLRNRHTLLMSGWLQPPSPPSYLTFSDDQPPCERSRTDVRL